MIWVAWLIQALIVAAYFAMARNSRYVRLYNCANFFGGILLAAYYALYGVWSALPLNLAFTAIGGYGLVRGAAKA